MELSKFIAISILLFLRDNLAHLTGANSNSLFAALEDWNVILKDTSIAIKPPANEDELPQAVSPHPFHRPNNMSAYDGGRENGPMEKHQDTVKRHSKKRVNVPVEKTAPPQFGFAPLLSEFIEAARGNMSKSDYINWLVEKEKSDKPADDLALQPQRRRRAPVKDHVQLAQAVALLGQSRLFSNLNQIAMHLNQGVHVATPDTEAELLDELSRTRQLRSLLYAALGRELAP